MRAFIVVFVLLGGCAATLPTATHNLLTPVEQKELQQGIDAWRAAGLPWPGRCEEQRSELRIAYPIGEAERDDLCQGRVSSCFIYRDDGGFALDPTSVPVFVVGEGIIYGVWKHEAVHWLASCSGFYRTKMDAARAGHGDRRLWGPDGVEGALGPQR